MNKIIYKIIRFILSISIWMYLIVLAIFYFYDIKIYKLKIYITNTKDFVIKYIDKDKNKISLTNPALKLTGAKIEKIEVATKYFPLVRLENTEIDLYPKIKIATKINNHYIAYSKNLITIDNNSYDISTSENEFQIKSESKTPLKWNKIDHQQLASLNLNFLSGFSGKIFLHTLNNNFIITARKIKSPLCNLEYGAFGINIKKMHIKSDIESLNCKNNLFVISKAKLKHKNNTTFLNVVSNFGTIESSRDINNIITNSKSATWKISNDLKLKNDNGHEIHFLPDADTLVKAKGNFDFSTQHIKGLLMHIGLAGDYNLELKKEKPFILLSLANLNGFLNNLAPNFFMTLNYNIENGMLDLNGSLDDLKGSGFITSNKGRIDLKALINDEITLLIQSNKLTLRDEASEIIGNINLTLGYADELKIFGDINISDGNLKFKNITATEILNEDIVFADEEALFPKYSINLNIKFLNRIKAYFLGINGYLGGWLNLSSSSSSGEKINGTLDLNPANFIVLGRQIFLDDLRITWINEHFNNANVNIVAHKNIASSDILTPRYVYLNIYGPILKPKVNLSSSQENMNELQMISYLFSRTTNSKIEEDKALIQALENNPGQKSLLRLLIMVDQIERKLGLDIFEFGSLYNNNSHNNHFILGKQIHPKILLKYTVNLDYDTRNQISLSYNIRDHINIEMSTDRETTGLYLLYEN